jgi:hypothetical protein
LKRVESKARENSGFQERRDDILVGRESQLFIRLLYALYQAIEYCDISRSILAFSNLNLGGSLHEMNREGCQYRAGPARALST